MEILELKCTITEMKISLEGLIIRCELAEGRLANLRSTEIMQSEEQM